MNNPNLHDLIVAVYADTLEPALAEDLARDLEDAINPHSQALEVTTKQYQGTRYFSVVHTARKRPVIFAGAVEQDSKKRRVPVVRFVDHNPILSQIPDDYKFEYRKGKWTNVELAKTTINFFPSLFQTEITEYLRQYSL